MTSPAKSSTQKPISFKAAKTPVKKAVKKPLKKSANDIFAKADATLTREYIELVVEAMGRK